MRVFQRRHSRCRRRQWRATRSGGGQHPTVKGAGAARVAVGTAIYTYLESSPPPRLPPPSPPPPPSPSPAKHTPPAVRSNHSLAGRHSPPGIAFCVLVTGRQRRRYVVVAYPRTRAAIRRRIVKRRTR